MYPILSDCLYKQGSHTQTPRLHTEIAPKDKRRWGSKSAAVHKARREA